MATKTEDNAGVGRGAWKGSSTRFGPRFPIGEPPARPVTGHRCDESNEVDRLIGGKTWREVADAFPVYCHDVFPLLTPAAMLY